MSLAEKAPDDLNTQREQCLTRIRETDEALADIKGQIMAAQARRHTEGVYADPHWWGRVNVAQKHHKRLRQQLQLELGAINRALRQEAQAAQVAQQKKAAFEAEAFVDVARDALDKVTYFEIWREARRRMQEAEHAGS